MVNPLVISPQKEEGEHVPLSKEDEGRCSSTSSSSSSSDDHVEDVPPFRDTMMIKPKSLLGTTEAEEEGVRVREPEPKTLNWSKALDAHLAHEFLDQMHILEEALRATRSQELLVLITGSSGTGKTGLAQSLEREAHDDRYVLVGRPSPSNTSVPYAPIVHALESLVHQVLDRGPEVATNLRQHILKNVMDSHILTTVVPALDSLLNNTQDDDDDDLAQDSENGTTSSSPDGVVERWVFVVRNFLRAVCQLQPLVLILDNMHQYDECTLQLLGYLVQDDTCGLLIVGTVNVDQVTGASHLSKKLRDFDERGTEIVDIQLKNLGMDSIVVYLAVLLNRSEEDVQSLASLVYRYTSGNLSVVTECIEWMVKNSFFSFEVASDRWTWEVDEIALELDTSLTGSIDDKDGCGVFLQQRLSSLPDLVLDMLKVSAALGLVVNEDVLVRIFGVEDTSPYLEHAVELGILESQGSIYIFANEGKMEAVYNLIPSEDREQFHLEIGRRLWRAIKSDEELHTHMFTIVSHMRIGRNLITKQAEKNKVASLCLIAGTKATKCSTFRVARTYLEFGSSLLCPRTSWREEYDLTLALYCGAAETEMCFGNFEKMDLWLEKVFAHARCFDDKLTAYGTKLYSYNVSNQQQKAIQLGLQVLEGLGETFPRRFTSLRLWKEMKNVKGLLRGKSDECLMRLPPLTDKRKFQALNFIQLMILTAMLDDQNLAPFLILRMMKITLLHGMSHLAAGAFSTYGILLVPFGKFGDIDEAVRFGNLGLQVTEKYRGHRCSPRVCAAYYGVVWCWKKPIAEVLEPLLTAHRMGMQNGDSEFASLCGDQYLMHAFETDIALDSLEREWQSFFEMLVSRRQETTIKMTLPWAQAIHHFLGMSEDPLSAKGDLIDYDAPQVNAAGAEKPCQNLTISMTRTILHYVMADYEGANRLGQHVGDVKTLPPSFERVSAVLYPALAVLAVGRTVGRKAALRKAERAREQLQSWVRCSPLNCVDKLLLLEAEIASLQGKKSKAYEKYVCAIATSGQSRFLLIHGLSNERLARHLLHVDSKFAARKYFDQALVTFEQWGAVAKVVRLREEIDTLYPK